MPHSQHYLKNRARVLRERLQDAHQRMWSLEGEEEFLLKRIQLLHTEIREIRDEIKLVMGELESGGDNV